MPRKKYARSKAPAVRTPWARVAVQILSDGRWHEADELRLQMQPHIPSRKALATFDANWMPPHHPQPRGGRIEQGRRYIAVHTLGNLLKESALERRGTKYRASWPTPTA